MSAGCEIKAGEESAMPRGASALGLYTACVCFPLWGLFIFQTIDEKSVVRARVAGGKQGLLSASVFPRDKRQLAWALPPPFGDLRGVCWEAPEQGGGL